MIVSKLSNDKDIDLFIPMNTLAGHLPPFLELLSLRGRLKRTHDLDNSLIHSTLHHGESKPNDEHPDIPNLCANRGRKFLDSKLGLVYYKSLLYSSTIEYSRPCLLFTIFVGLASLLT